MPRQKEPTSSAAAVDIPSVATKEMSSSAKDLTSIFLSVLENQDVIAKLAEALSTSFHLILDEKLVSINGKLDKIISDNKDLTYRVSVLENENKSLKSVNQSLDKEINSVKTKLNYLEQATRRNNVIITGIPETFAEKVTETEGEDAPPANIREDTVAAVCEVVKESCGLTSISATDIHYAQRLKSKLPGPRPVLVSFMTLAMRETVIKARRPKQTLSFRGGTIYINEHLTDTNANLLHTVRQLIKKGDAHSSWTRNGQIYIKWEQNSRPLRVQSTADLV